MATDSFSNSQHQFRSLFRDESVRVELNTILDHGELIRLELNGKFVAIGRYDDIIWRVRSGYVIVLYGSLALLIGEGEPFSRLLQYGELLSDFFIVVFGFSILAAVTDINYRLKQLNVVEAFNKLMDIAVGEDGKLDTRAEELRELLHISGESPTRVSLVRRLGVIFLIILFYMVAPGLLGTLFFFLGLAEKVQ